MSQRDKIQAATVGAFQDPLAAWIDTVKEMGLDPHLAFCDLVLFWGHVLAGVAEELEVSPNPKEVGDILAETLAEELSEMGLGALVAVH